MASDSHSSEPSNNSNVKLPHLFALVIGINEYSQAQSLKFESLNLAVKDARDFSTYLENHLKLDPAHIIRLYDADASRKAILNAFSRLIDLSTGYDKNEVGFIIFFSGHGTSFKKPDEWRDWQTVDEFCEGLCSADFGETIPPIPDRTVAALLNKLSRDRGNNITVILDCCFSAGATREAGAAASGEGFVDRFIHTSTPMPPDYDGEIMRSTDLARGISIANGFSGKDLSSHLLIAAAGREHQAFSKDEHRNSVFTRALLRVLEAEGSLHLTYRGLMHQLQMPWWQQAHCEGAEVNRRLFRNEGGDYRFIFGMKAEAIMASGTRNGIYSGYEVFVSQYDHPSSPRLGIGIVTSADDYTSTLAFAPITTRRLNSGLDFFCKPRTGGDWSARGFWKTQLILAAGHLHGVAVGSKVSVHKYAFSSVKGNPPIATCKVASVRNAFSTLELPTSGISLPDTFYARVLTRPSESFRIFTQDNSLSLSILGNEFCEDNGTIAASNVDEADLSLVRKGGAIQILQHFPPPVKQPRFPFRLVPKELGPELRTIVQHAIDYRRCFNAIKFMSGSPLDNVVTMEIKALRGENYVPDNKDYRSIEPRPGTNEVEVHVGTPYGLAVTNTSEDLSLYPHLFYFDPWELSITPWYLPPVGAGTAISNRNVDATLPPGHKLTIGYGSFGAHACKFTVRRGETEEVGFLRLYLTTTPVNMGSIVQGCPFPEPRGDKADDDDDDGDEGGGVAAPSIPEFGAAIIGTEHRVAEYLVQDGSKDPDLWGIVDLTLIISKGTVKAYVYD